MQDAAVIRYCPSCGERLKSDLTTGQISFCSSCGSRLGSSGPGPGTLAPTQMDDEHGGKRFRRYPIRASVPDLAGFLTRCFKNDGYVTQCFAIGTDEAVVQIKKSGVFRMMVSATRSLTVRIRGVDAATTVEVGSAAWADKAGAGIAGLVFFWPSFLFMGSGMYLQHKLCNQLWERADRYFDHISARDR